MMQDVGKDKEEGNYSQKSKSNDSSEGTCSRRYRN